MEPKVQYFNTDQLEYGKYYYYAKEPGVIEHIVKCHGEESYTIIIETKSFNKRMPSTHPRYVLATDEQAEWIEYCIGCRKFIDYDYFCRANFKTAKPIDEYPLSTADLQPGMVYYHPGDTGDKYAESIIGYFQPYSSTLLIIGNSIFSKKATAYNMKWRIANDFEKDWLQECVNQDKFLSRNAFQQVLDCRAKKEATSQLYNDGCVYTIEEEEKRKIILLWLLQTRMDKTIAGNPVLYWDVTKVWSGTVPPDRPANRISLSILLEHIRNNPAKVANIKSSIYTDGAHGNLSQYLANGFSPWARPHYEYKWNIITQEKSQDFIHKSKRIMLNPKSEIQAVKF
jgi:hypothetical protein